MVNEALTVILFSLKTDYFVAFFDEVGEINLFGSIMVSILHTVEVKELASGLQYAFGKGEKFRLLQNGIFFR